MIAMTCVHTNMTWKMKAREETLTLPKCYCKYDKFRKVKMQLWNKNRMTGGDRADLYAHRHDMKDEGERRSTFIVPKS